MPVATDDVFPGPVLGTGSPLPPQPKSTPYAPQFHQRVTDVADAHAEAVRELIDAFHVTPAKLRDLGNDAVRRIGIDGVQPLLGITDEHTHAEGQPNAAHFDVLHTRRYDP